MQSIRTSAGDSKERAVRAVSDLFERLACAAKSSAMTEVAETDLTFSQFRTLMELGSRATAQSVNELADAVGLSVAAAGRIVDKLVGLGYTDRREDPTDRRVKRVSLTDAGHRFVRTAVNARIDAVRTLVARLPDDLANNLVDALEPIIDSDVDYFTPLKSPTEGQPI